MANSTIERAFEHLHAPETITVSAYRKLDPRRLDEFVTPGNVADARYKIHLLAANTSYSSAIVRYRGQKYYVARDYVTGAINVELTR